MKSLLGRMGLSPLHIKRPSFIVVLNLMNTFVLDPDTLFNAEEGNNSKIFNWNSLLSNKPKRWYGIFSPLVLLVNVLQLAYMLMCE